MPVASEIMQSYSLIAGVKLYLKCLGAARLFFSN